MFHRITIIVLKNAVLLHRKGVSQSSTKRVVKFCLQIDIYLAQIQIPRMSRITLPGFKVPKTLPGLEMP
jgi:hypothetical protein